MVVSMLNICVYILLLALLGVGAHFLCSKKETAIFCRRTLLVIALLELVVFNFSSYHLWFGGYQRTQLSLDDATLSGFQQNEDGNYVLTGGSGTVAWENLNNRVGTISLDISLSGAAQTSVRVDAADETNQAYRRSVGSASIINGNERTKTFPMELSGNVSMLRLNFSSAEGETLLLTGVTVNRAVPLHLSPLRLLLFFFLVLGIHVLRRSETLSLPCKEQSDRLTAAAGVITVVCVLTAGILTVLYRGAPVPEVFRSNTGNQITKELVDAFEAGQVSLLTEPSKELLALNNPYDWSERSQARVSYLWDHCLYQGKYYSYYGIAPVLLLFLPYHLLTGFYFPTPEAVFLFGALGIVFLTLIWLTFVRRFFPKLPLRFGIAGLILLQATSGIWYCFSSPLFYEIAQSSGFAFTTAGFWLLLSSGCVGPGAISRKRLCFAAICLSLAVLCRPTLAVYCIAALFFLALGLKKCVAEAKTQGQSPKKPIVTYLLASLLPFAVIGSVQMIYNYLRFDSFFDFGIQYSLTINDFTRSEYHFRFVLIGLYNYLIAVPQIDLSFPFIHSSFQTLDTNGYYFIANRSAIGILFRALPTLAWFRAGSALRRLKRSERLTACLTIGVTSLLCPLVILWSIWESGYGARYCVDFTWQILLGALAVAFFLWQKSENETKKKLCSELFVWSCAASVAVAFAIHYAYSLSCISDPAELAVFASFERLFTFWKA